MITGDLLIGSERVRGRERSFRAVNPVREGWNPLNLRLRLQDNGGCGAGLHLGVGRRLTSTARLRSRKAGGLSSELIAANVVDLGSVLIERAMAETALPVPASKESAREPWGNLSCSPMWCGRENGSTCAWIGPLPDRKPLPRSELSPAPHSAWALSPCSGRATSRWLFRWPAGTPRPLSPPGGPVIVKGHPAHAGTGELVGAASRPPWRACGLPDGVFSLLLGAVETGAALVGDPRIKAVGFTGSRWRGHGARRHRGRAAGADPGLCRNEHQQPGLSAARRLSARAEASGRGTSPR